MKLRSSGGIATLVVDWLEPDGSGIPALSPERLVLGSVRAGDPLLVDLSQVHRARSDLFGYLARLKQVLSRQGSRLVVLATEPDVIRLFDVLRLGRVFCIAHSRTMALRACRLELPPPIEMAL